MESVDKNKNGDAVPRKINVNFSETEKEFNSDEKTLEDIIDEELAFDSNSEPVIEENVDDFKKAPIDFQVNEHVFDDVESEESKDLILDLTEDEPVAASNAQQESGAEILSMEEVFEPNSKQNEEKKEKTKGGHGLIGFFLGVILATIVLFGLFYLLYAQIIPNDIFPGKPAEQGEPVGSSEPTTSTTDSALDLAFLKTNNTGVNTIYSPLSIKYGLTLLSESANGNTKTEIDNVLGNLNLTKYENIPDVLSLANSIFVRDGFAIKKEYKTTVTEKLGVEILSDPFVDAANVNSWISNKTFGLIQNAVPNEAINSSTTMALVNALAIQMEWENGFDLENTYGADFTKADDSIVSATMMNATFFDDDLGYYADDEVTVVRKDLKKYDDTQLEFVAIMPNMETSLSSYVDSLGSRKINDLLAKTTSAGDSEAGVFLSIPKFKFDYSLDNFKDNLIELGIKDAFDEMSADFSNIADGGLYVNNAIHKANIDFSENGIKAAAVTVFALDESAIIQEQSEPVEIQINRPFFFEIRDKENGEVWFTGTVYEPNLWENDQAAYIAQ